MYHNPLVIASVCICICLHRSVWVSFCVHRSVRVWFCVHKSMWVSFCVCRYTYTCVHACRGQKSTSDGVLHVLSALFFICLFICVCMCTHSARDRHQVSSFSVLHLRSWCRVSQWSQSLPFFRLADQWAPKLPLSLLLQCWDYKCKPLCLASSCVFLGDPAQSITLVQLALSQLPHPHPQPFPGWSKISLSSLAWNIMITTYLGPVAFLFLVLWRLSTSDICSLIVFT